MKPIKIDSPEYHRERSIVAEMKRQLNAQPGNMALENSLKFHVDKLAEIIMRLDSPLENHMAHVNGRAKVHTMNNGCELRTVAARAEYVLNSRSLAKKHWPGVRVQFTTQGAGRQYSRKANCHNGNKIVLERGSDHWKLVDFQRVDIYATDDEKMEILISEKVADEIKKNSIVGFTISGS